MKKLIFIFICFFSAIVNISASERQIVTLNKCVDGDTAWFNLDNEAIKVRFLGIDTPESTNKIEEYGKEASNYTCNALKNATTIEIEYDDNSDKLDKYNRHLVWVFIDNGLLQENILKEGLAEVKYIYGDYKYLDVLNNAQSEAQKNQLNIWSNYTNDDSNILYTIVVLIALVLIIIIFNPKKSTIKKLIKKYL